MKDNIKRDICIFTGSGFSAALFNQKTQNDFVSDFVDFHSVSKSLEYFKDELKETEDIEILMSHYFNLAYDDNLKCKCEKFIIRYVTELENRKIKTAIPSRLI